MEDYLLKWPGKMTTKEASHYLLTNGFVAIELYRVALRKLEEAPASTPSKDGPPTTFLPTSPGWEGKR